jgi:hypothetical protein
VIAEFYKGIGAVALRVGRKQSRLPQHVLGLININRYNNSGSYFLCCKRVPYSPPKSWWQFTAERRLCSPAALFEPQCELLTD